MHTELLACLLDEVRTVVLKLDRIACALEEIDYAAQHPLMKVNTDPAPRPHGDHYPYMGVDYFYASQLDRGRAE